MILLLAEEAAGIWGPVHWGLPSVAWHAINFVIFVAIIYFAARKGMIASARVRRDRIAHDIEEATKLRDEMRATFADYESRMKDIDARMDGILADARKMGESEKASILAEAEKTAQRIREEAKTVADQEIARAKKELQDEQIARAAELAETLLKSAVNKDDQSRLAQDFLGSMEPKAPAKVANGKPRVQ